MKRSKALVLMVGALAIVGVADSLNGDVIVLRSGQVNGLPGSEPTQDNVGPVDDSITYWANNTCGAQLSNLPFSSADFDAALNGAPAELIVPHPAPAWIPSLPSDPDARWINWNHGTIRPNVGSGNPPRSVLYAQEFMVESPGISTASIDFYWAVDDRLGDPDGGANEIGVYLNGVPLSMDFRGSGASAEKFATQNDIESLLNPCGANTLYVYQRDAGCSVSGILYSAHIVIAGLNPDLDIKPGSCPNPFNRGSHGVLPVAVVGSAEFEVTEIDVSSVRLSRADGVGGQVAPNEGPPGPHSEFEDLATPFCNEQCDCHDLEGDGITDLSMHFISDEVVDALELNDLPAGDLVELVVSGMLLDGTPFTASDCIQLVPPGAPPGLLAVGSNAPGVWIDVSPRDDQLDGGGFAGFERTFPLGTFVTLTAPKTYQGRMFAHWKLTGLLPRSRPAALQRRGTSVDILILGDQLTIKAIYEARSSLLEPPARRFR